MRFSEAKNQKVVSTAEAITVGRVREFIVDPRSSQVVALGIKTTKKAGTDGDTIAWTNLKAFGRDVATIESTKDITLADGEIAVLGDKQHRVLGKLVLSDAGVELGKVDDVDFDPDSGAIRSLLTDSEEIDGGRMVGLGSYAVVVRAQR